MTLRYYIAPWQTVSVPHNPVAQGSGVLVYSRFNTSTIKANGVKPFCLTAIDTDLVMHDTIAKDSLIFQLPIDPDRLDLRWDSLLLADRTLLGDALDTRRIPTSWIVDATTLREVLKQLIRTLLACQRLGVNYPEAPLDTRWNQLPKGMQDAIRADLVEQGVLVEDIAQTTTLDGVVRKFALATKTVKWLDKDASISDNFNRGDSTSLGVDWTEDNGDWAITSNTLRCTTGAGAYHKCRHNTSLDSANYDIEVDGRSGTATVGVGAFGRGAVSATVTYYSFISFEGDANYIAEITAGGETLLATGTAPPAASTNFRLRCDGSTLTGYENDVQDATVVDATLASGAVGVAAYGVLDAAGAFADNFAAADLAGGPVVDTTRPGSVRQQAFNPALLPTARKDYGW